MIVNFCTVRGCMAPPEANGLCGPHHIRWCRKKGTPGGAGITASIIRWWRENRKPGCHCWACRRLNKAQLGDLRLRAEQHYHLYLWETGPTVTPDRGQS